jgi:hypothetical protein
MNRRELLLGSALLLLVVIVVIVALNSINAPILSALEDPIKGTYR